MKRKLLALTLAITTLMSTSMMVSAGSLENSASLSTGQEVTGESTVGLPTIKVTVPTTADIVINPYKINYNDADAGITGNSQIVSAEQEISNESDVAVAVNVSDLQVTNISEGITITTASTAKETSKAAFLYLEVIDAMESGAAFADAFNAKSTQQLAIPYIASGDTKTKKASKDAIVTLKAGNETPQKAKFKIGGDVVANPVTTNSDKTTTQTPWTEDDSIQIGFKFTFTPQVVEATTSTN